MDFTKLLSLFEGGGTGFADNQAAIKRVKGGVSRISALARGCITVIMNAWVDQWRCHCGYGPLDGFGTCGQ